jgi:shikimate dehydrogenase
LGLIGDNIAASQAPRLHRLAGELTGRVVTYDRLVPRERGLTFEALFAACQAEGYRGLNITYPYKERAARLVTIPDPLVQAMGAINTVVFTDDGPRGFNTDYSGFVAAIRAGLAGTPVGRVMVMGAGGVGRAIAFGLVALGVTGLTLVDPDGEKTHALAAAVRGVAPDLAITTGTDAIALSAGIEGLINASPIGMVGYDGTPLPASAMAGARWAFDAVYTPVDTRFLIDARAAGLTVISGYELFFGQGVDAYRIFTGLGVDPDRLWAALLTG